MHGLKNIYLKFWQGKGWMMSKGNGKKVMLLNKMLPSLCEVPAIGTLLFFDVKVGYDLIH